MKVAIAYDQTEQPWSLEWKRALYEGVRAVGDEALLVSSRDICEVGADVTATWGIRAGRLGIMRRTQERGGRHLVMELGYFGDRTKWTSLGFDGLNGKADFVNANSPPDRWEQHVNLLKPWREDGDFVLIIGQVPGDTAVEHVNLDRWYAEMARAITAAGEKPVFRPHPITVKRDQPLWTGCDIIMGDLSASLARAKWVVTFNSNVGVDALLAGVPVVAMDEGAMVYQLAGHEPGVRPPTPDRTQFFNNLAYCQWTMDEIKSGAAWKHLRRGVH